MPEREHQVNQAFVTLADSLVDDYDIIDLLDQLVAHCVSLLAAESAGIVLGDARGQLRAVAASSEAAQAMELLQVQADQGPCLDSFSTATAISVPDIGQAADRWPRVVDVLTRAGFAGSVHAIPLRLRGQAIGALNLFHRSPGPLPERDLALGQALADVATIGILSERAIRRGEVVTEQLQTALDSRVVIEQAKGVLSQQLDAGMDVAFERLRRYSRNNNLRLSEVARQVVAGELATGDIAPEATGDIAPESVSPEAVGRQNARADPSSCVRR
ncbi:GAF domain-containing protein [Pseudonocardia sediminis]|uniref:GAF domain-containing protein n=1 Tax=Pseudonocardia sediminis TaxID=1397368 RepID=A0A4Q7UXR2_PSEST|nr:GAF and ANTAR domain-containing protein [Pseudonocardia sediminis]RZT86696.1 GAF domain-containing protein [Pseudonocardia sediminis]